MPDIEDRTVDPKMECGEPHKRRLRWWFEFLLVLGFYLIYSLVRNQFGSASVSTTTALRNAEYIIDLEKAIGLYLEAEIQSHFLDLGWFLRFWNIFYGTLHFVVTGFAMIWLYLRYPADYPRLRTIGLVTTGIALAGFALFPLMPPRLLGDCGNFGACLPSDYLDTVAVHGSWWSFNSGAGAAVSNQYAAMPSLHFAWASWSFLVLWPRIRNYFGRAFIAAYPWLTLFAIVVTANHYWIDAVGGGLTLALAWVVGKQIYRRPKQHGHLLEHGTRPGAI